MKRFYIALLTFVLLVSNSIQLASASPNQGPGPNEPVDVKELGSFKSEENWNINGATRKDTTNGTVFKLTGQNATISKEFTYKTWDYSDLSIEVKNISSGMSWGLFVKGIDQNAREMTIQNQSKFANSQHGESFTYSLEGLAGEESKSNWNNESLTEKTFTMTFKLIGKVDDEIKLGKLRSMKPNYEIPKALDSNVKGKYGGMNFDGDPTLDVDNIKNDDPGLSTSQSLKEHQWTSLPYSRLVINPGWEFDNGKMTPVDRDLDFRFGAYYGINGNSNRAIGAEAKSGFQPSFYNSILDIDGERIDTNTLKSVWYPHKLERSGIVQNKGTVSLFDFMVDINTMGRVIDFESDTGTLNITIKDSTKNGGAKAGQHNLKAFWDDVNKVVLKTDDLEEATNLFYQATKVVALHEDGSYDDALTKQIITPTFVDGVGSYQIPNQVKKIGLAIGYATREEGKEVAINRALKNTTQGNLLESYKVTKDFWNKLLRKAPVPEKWGAVDKNINNGDIVTPEKHKVLYYSGYVFNSINTLGATPETGYAFAQQTLGKPSRQVGGGKMTPANNSWEGVLQVQNIMYTNPSASWSAMEGFMSMVDANGFLNGEVLPVRMAQTFWMLNTVSPDKERLRAIYPALSRHLKYKISDPRWIYGNEQTQNEIDQEYITSWLNDVIYMKKICGYLGGDYAKEINYWEAEYQKSLANYADWFFSDPSSHEAKGSYPEDGSGPRTLRNGAGLKNANQARGLWTRIFQLNGDVTAIKDTCSTNNDDGNHYAHSNKGSHVISPAPARFPREWLQVILSGLVVKDIPTKEAQQLEQFFLDINNPILPLSGLENLKWAPNSFIVYGLLNRGFYDEAKNQLDSYLVKSIEVWEFCENYKYAQSGPYGTCPTSFGASQIIELTMLMNGAMNDGSGVKEIENWGTGKNKAKSPAINLYYTGEFDKTAISKDLPKEVLQVYERVNFNGEKYSVNKPTAVNWDIDKMTLSRIKDQQQSKVEVVGETETNDKITATVYLNVTSVELKSLIDQSKSTIDNAPIGDKMGEYSQKEIDNLNRVILDSEAIANDFNSSTEIISRQIQKLKKSLYDFAVKPLNHVVDYAKELTAKATVGNELGQYTQKAVDQMNKSINLVQYAFEENTNIKIVIQNITQLSKEIHTFRVSPINEMLIKAKKVLSETTIGDKEGEYRLEIVDKFSKKIQNIEKKILMETITDNEIKDLILQLDIEIKEFKESRNEDSGDTGQNQKPNTPETSDDSGFLMNLIGVTVALSMGVLCFVIKRKKDHK